MVGRALLREADGVFWMFPHPKTKQLATSIPSSEYDFGSNDFETRRAFHSFSISCLTVLRILLWHL
jgi:hypothetical protein